VDPKQCLSHNGLTPKNTSTGLGQQQEKPCKESQGHPHKGRDLPILPLTLCFIFSHIEKNNMGMQYGEIFYFFFPTILPTILTKPICEFRF
jgi:hypothetical protein